MGISRYNSEGYSDPTSHAALSGIRKEEKAVKRTYRPLVYICSPFAGDTEGNTQKARRYSRFAVKNGVKIKSCSRMTLRRTVSLSWFR